MEDNRGLIVLLFCLPASFVFDLVLQFRNWFYRNALSAPLRHDERVRQIQTQVSIFKIGRNSYSSLFIEQNVGSSME